jgi:hypothetical protein
LNDSLLFYYYNSTWLFISHSLQFKIVWFGLNLKIRIVHWNLKIIFKMSVFKSRQVWEF